MMSILKQKLSAFIAENRREIFVFVVIFLIVFLSFGTGYLVGRNLTPTPIIIENARQSS